MPCSAATAPASRRSCAAFSASRRRPPGGRLLFGADSWTTRREAMARTGVVPEEPDAPPAMTARRSVGLLPAHLPALGRGGRRLPPRALRRCAGDAVRPPLARSEDPGPAGAGARSRSRAAGARRSDTRARPRRAARPLRRDRRRARRPRHDDLSDDARPGRLRGNRDARRHSQGRQAPARRGDGGA